VLVVCFAGADSNVVLLVVYVVNVFRYLVVVLLVLRYMVLLSVDLLLFLINCVRCWCWLLVDVLLID